MLIFTEFTITVKSVGVLTLANHQKKHKPQLWVMELSAFDYRTMFQTNLNSKLITLIYLRDPPKMVEFIVS